MGLVGGLLGFGPDDDRLPISLKIAKEQGIKVSFQILDYLAGHPNTFRMTIISDRNEVIHLTALSVGGGMIELQEIEGIDVEIAGDFYETLVLSQDIDEAGLKTKSGSDRSTPYGF